MKNLRIFHVEVKRKLLPVTHCLAHKIFRTKSISGGVFQSRWLSVPSAEYNSDIGSRNVRIIRALIRGHPRMVRAIPGRTLVRQPGYLITTNLPICTSPVFRSVTLKM